MKAIRNSFVLILFPLFAFAQKADSPFKVITYNIWNGFDFGKDQERRVKLQAWMNAQMPDVAALQELCNYTTEKLREDAARWGHTHSVLMKTTGYSVGITSKFPIELIEKITEGMHHGALHCRTNGIDFLVVHLNPGSYQIRRIEAEILTKKVKEISKVNSKMIVLGDFNSHSPFDADLYQENGYFLQRLKKSNSDKGETGNLDHGELDYGVMSSFLALPLYDVIRKYSSGMQERGSFPTRALGEINKETADQLDSRKEHIDFIMVSSELYRQSVSAKVLNGRDTWFLSDHYPATATFVLPNSK
jgi:exodeoxyribonuclease III